MRDLSVRVLLAAALICSAAVPAWADFDDGLAAYNAGDYATALKEFRPIAEQGHFFDRGNQQVSARVISRVGIEHITIAATIEKIASLRDNLLQVDTGDAALDARLCGWRRVITGYQTDTVCRVST